MTASSADPPEEDFRTLGLPTTASIADVKQARRDYVQLLHPDKYMAQPQLWERAQNELQQKLAAAERLERWFAAVARSEASSAKHPGFGEHSAPETTVASNEVEVSHPEQRKAHQALRREIRRTVFAVGGVMAAVGFLMTQSPAAVVVAAVVATSYWAVMTRRL